MHHLIRELYDNLETIQKTYLEDVTLLLADHQAFVKALPGKQHDLGIRAGETLEQYSGTVTYKAFETGKPTYEERDASRFGFPYVAAAIPIFDGGQVIGVFSSVTPTEIYDAVINGSSALAANVEEITATTETVADASLSMNDTIQSVSALVHNMTQNVESIKAISDFVREIAEQSKMLGLNAMIEAAHAGEMGRGFSIVAQEIRKMADQSKESAQNIKNQMESIVMDMERIQEMIYKIAKTSEENTMGINDIRTAMEGISQVAVTLSDQTHNFGALQQQQ